MTLQILDQSKAKAFKYGVWFKPQFLIKQYGALNRAAQSHLCACPICKARHVSNQADKMHGVTRNNAGNVPVRRVRVDVVQVPSVPENRLQLNKGVIPNLAGWTLQDGEFWPNLARPFTNLLGGAGYA